MIPRYAHPEMSEIFSPKQRYELWLRIELIVSEGWAEIGEIPRSAVDRLRQARVDPDHIARLEERVGHDVVAFLDSIAESIGGDDARYLHRGLTSSDVLDTALALQLVQAADILLKDVDRLSSVIRRRAIEERDTLMAGRTHGIHAEPISFGFVLAGWLDELDRDRQRLVTAREDIRVGKLSGAVGTHATVEPRVEESSLKKLGLKVAPVTTQVIARDRHAAYLMTLAVLAGGLEKFATDIRHLQRSEVSEVREPFGEEQKGSSAMPHKRNPILSERVCGLARVVRGYAQTSLENQALWHERDISHSSAERIIFPDACTLIDYMLRLMADILEGLTIDRERMRANLYRSGGVVFSQRVLLALVQKGMTRQDAYRLVQRTALSALDGGPDFKTAIGQSPEVRERLTERELAELFDPAYYLRHLDVTFERLGIEPAVVEARRT
ncbi:MAG TPA: adenylosuccinate lyase [Candidatus Dormibacteraeota bacterium]|nr:adenylosuccinate lyase [Candidatus Dormibacteraeota bacterium]